MGDAKDSEALKIIEEDSGARGAECNDVDDDEDVCDPTTL